MNAAPILVRGLNHYFGEGKLRQQVLCDVNVTIDPGEIVILAGPSGSGKTTLLTLIGALRKTQEGSVRVLGEELRDASEDTLTLIRRRIGYIFQAHNLLGALTAAQNVRVGMTSASEVGEHEQQRRAAEALEQVGLAGRLDAYPSQLSGGQRQRVAIARALANRPELVLADEPTASLDKRTGRDVAELLRRLARSRRIPVVLVTHDSRILDIADRILSLEDGRLSSLMAAVTNETRRSLDLLVRTMRKGDLAQRSAQLDDEQFHEMLDEITGETRSLLALIELLQGATFESLAEQVDSALAGHVTRELNAESAALFFVDPDGLNLRRCTVPDGGQKDEATHPKTRGIVGRVATTGESHRLEEVGRCSHFDPLVDGAETRTALTVPVRGSDGIVIAVLQARNKRDPGGFDATDEWELQRLAGSLGPLLESWWRMSCACRAGPVDWAHACCPPGRPVDTAS